MHIRLGDARLIVDTQNDCLADGCEFPAAAPTP